MSQPRSGAETQGQPAVKGSKPGGKAKGKGKRGKGAADGAQVVYARKDRRSGIHTIEIYHPQFYFKQTEMEYFDADPNRYGPSVIGKYTKGIGQIEARFVTDDEDAVSFALTVVHRLLDRIDQKGLNETGRYQPDGKALPVWNSVGRLDVGSESLIDRSKSIKSYVMDLFERYGQENNIEGVDQYNACYGGQAAGLAVQSWIESDRWDGRYGVAVATDISEAHSSHMFTTGAASTASLFFPDAPLAHHSVRASCILNRFDFLKPVGWYSIAPLTDGKYSIEVYMNAAEHCWRNLQKKIGRGPLSVTDYNVFHTGGGYHVVKKVFEKLYRTEYKDSTKAALQEDLQARLTPSVHLLKIIGPCHTVSSFLNTSSIIMSQWDKALGKVILVFTFGSGCASSMYQLHFDDIPLMDPLEVWRLRYYRESIYTLPAQACQIHHHYFMTWMLFDWVPCGRQKENIPLDKYELDVYYLLHMDKWGRRWYHRGGVMGAELPKEFRLREDEVEDRTTRADFGPAPARQAAVEAPKALDYELKFDDNLDSMKIEVVGTFDNRYEVGKTQKILKPISTADALEDGADNGKDLPHQIVGSWTCCKEIENMKQLPDGSFIYEVTIGENRWEHFNIIQDKDPARRIYPFYHHSGQKQPCCGPGKAGEKQRWLLDCRSRATTPSADIAMPGEKFRISLRYDGSRKEVAWEKMQGSQGEVIPSTYFVLGSWSDFEPQPLAPDADEGEGWFSTTATTSQGYMEFYILRNGDAEQRISPQPVSPDDPIDMDTPIGGPGESSTRWRIDCQRGSEATRKILFYRDPEDPEPSGMRIEWLDVQ
mmetsp:Transcript_30028/g.69960  ORF Transcript_30028/g.69960 Transcript_30028/m.69960 type:complete len:821 (-) Transcript_30028:19-2481(-)